MQPNFRPFTSRFSLFKFSPILSFNLFYSFSWKWEAAETWKRWIIGQWNVYIVPVDISEHRIAQRHENTFITSAISSPSSASAAAESRRHPRRREQRHFTAFDWRPSGWHSIKPLEYGCSRCKWRRCSGCWPATAELFGRHFQQTRTKAIEIGRGVDEHWTLDGSLILFRQHNRKIYDVLWLQFTTYLQQNHKPILITILIIIK